MMQRSLRLIHEMAPDNEAHHARTKVRFLRKRHFRFTPKADVGPNVKLVASGHQWKSN